MNEEEILAQLKKQTELLEEIRHALLQGSETNKRKEVSFRTEITDFNMSIGSMIDFMAKWLVAAIPVGIILGVIYAIFSSVISAASY